MHVLLTIAAAVVSALMFGVSPAKCRYANMAGTACCRACQYYLDQGYGRRCDDNITVTLEELLERSSLVVEEEEVPNS